MTKKRVSDSRDMNDTPTIPELLRQHLDAVTDVFPAAHVYGNWPDGADFGMEDESTIEAFGSWCFIDGFASALDMTATELLDEHGLMIAELPPTDKPCPKCGGKLRPCSTSDSDYHCDACEAAFEAHLFIER